MKYTQSSFCLVFVRDFKSPNQPPATLNLHFKQNC